MTAAMACYRAGLAALRDGGGVPAARLRSVLGWALYRAHEPGALELVADSALVLAEHGAPAVASRALDRLAVLSPDPDTALDASDRAFVHLSRSADRRELGTLLVHRAGIEQRAGRPAAAVRSADEALAIFRAAGDAYMESVSHWNRASALDAVGDLAAALSARDAEAALLLEIDNPRNLAGCLTHRATLLLRLGRSEEARAAAAAAVLAANSAGDPLLIERGRPSRPQGVAG
jgi:tetratricopeptide (TPR) repeat protein